VSALGPQFSHSKPGSEAFSAFVRIVAFERAGHLRRCFNAQRSGDLIASNRPPVSLRWPLVQFVECKVFG